MNTKVKVGIAIAIVTALIALIVLDQSTTPGTSGDQPAPAPKPSSTGVQRESLTPAVDHTAPASQELRSLMPLIGKRPRKR